jgi:DNA-directed RNA polymerase specialized sigma24 family protein
MAMDHEHLVRRAIEGDKTAFVNLTRRFQHFAFGSALAEVGDFQRAEDIVQESLVVRSVFRDLMRSKMASSPHL